MYVLILCNVTLLPSWDFHHHFYCCSSFHGFTYLLTSFSGVFLRKFDGHIFKFLYSSVCASTSTTSEPQTRKRHTVTNQLLLSALLSTESASLNALPFRDLSAHARGATGSHNDFSDQGMVWPGSSEEPHLRAKSPLEKMVWKLQLHSSYSWRRNRSQDAGGVASVSLFIASGMWLRGMQQNCTHIMCSTLCSKVSNSFKIK